MHPSAGSLGGNGYVCMAAVSFFVLLLCVHVCSGHVCTCIPLCVCVCPTQSHEVDSLHSIQGQGLPNLLDTLHIYSTCNDMS